MFPNPILYGNTFEFFVWAIKGILFFFVFTRIVCGCSDGLLRVQMGLVLFIMQEVIYKGIPKVLVSLFVITLFCHESYFALAFVFTMIEPVVF